MEPKVSIITPAYNCEQLIGYTIESVLAQDYENWEMNIVDDNSKDGTADVIKSYMAKDSRIHLYQSKTQLSAAGARNKSLELSTGRFVAYLDSDDLWTPDKLSKQVKFMLEKDIAFSNTAYQIIDQQGNLKNKKIYMLERCSYDGFLTHNLLQTVGLMADLDKIDRKLLIQSTDAEREDTATWLQVLKAGFDCYGLNEILGYYRRVENSRSSNKIKASLGVWDLYRNREGLSLPYASYCFVRYAVLAVWKRIYIFKQD